MIVASRPRFGCYSQVRTLVTQPGRNQLERHSWTGTGYSHETGTRLTGFSYIYRYLLVPQVELIAISTEPPTVLAHSTRAIGYLRPSVSLQLLNNNRLTFL
jgi:hypothetical protein